MAAEELVPSPLARRLLDLAERGAEGTIEVAGRTLRIAHGGVVGLTSAPGADDGDVATHLVRGGQLSQSTADLARKRALERSISLEEALTTLQVSPDELEAAQRGHWVELLARGLDALEEEQAAESPFSPSPDPRHNPTGFPLLELLLDALVARATTRDADLVEAAPDRRMVWETSPHLAGARAWSELLAPETNDVAAELAAREGAAQRIAALARAGLLSLRRAGDETPPAEPRPASLAPPPRVSLPAAPMAKGRLDPGAHVLDSVRRRSRMDRFPAQARELADPFDPIERRITQLEETEAPGAQRAEVWAEFAELWEEQAGAITEASRSYREAAAAAPDHTHALERAAIHCASMGEHSLAAAYAHAMSAAARDGGSRAAAFAMMGRSLLREGREDEGLDAYREALACESADPDLHLRLADRLERRGDVEGAAAALEDAADALGDRSVDLAVAAARRACRLRGDSASATASLARTLARYGYGEAAITLLAVRIDLTDDDAGRRDMVLVAAQIAEASERPDRAAELLMDAVDAEPEVDVFYELVAAHLELSGMRMDLAVMLEAIAAANTWGQRAEWLVRAGEVFSTLYGRDDWARELHERALVEDPASEAPLEALEAIAQRAGDATILADALERAARASLSNEPEAAQGLLERLAILADTTLSSPARALWAWRRLDEQRQDELSHIRAEGIANELEPLLRAAERAELELDEAAPEARPAAMRRLLEQVRHIPDWRERAVELYAELLEADPTDGATADAYESLLSILGDDERLDDALERRASRAAGDELSRALRWLAALRSLAGNYVGSADACMRLLALDPSHEEGIVRLDRAARRTGTLDLRRRALASRLSLDRGARHRALTFSRMAAIDLREGDVEPAVDHARQAVRVDPGATDALTVLLDRIDDLAPEEAEEVFGQVEAALGNTDSLCRAMVAHALRHGDALARSEALGRQARVDPLDGARATAWLEAAVETEDENAIDAAARHGVDPTILEGPDDALLVRAAERLSSLGSGGRALRLLIEAGRERSSAALARSAVELSRRTAGQSYDVEALELDIAVAPREERGTLLEELAEFHRRSDAPALESRTLLRRLAEGSAPDALSRLSNIYAETGETDRLMAVLAVRLEQAEDAASRRPRLMDLAAASLTVAGDDQRARAFLAQVLDEGGDDPEALLDCADGYTALGEAERGMALLIDAAERERTSGVRESEGVGRLYERAMDLAEAELGDGDKALQMALAGLEVAPSNPGLLMGFERITLGRRDVELATKTYDRLADESYGQHGRRGVRYRQARWFELAEAFPEALAAYSEAFAMNPSEGVVFSSLERLSKKVGDYAPVVDAYVAIAEGTPHVDRRIELVTRAADLADLRLDDPGRAFDLMVELWRATGQSPLLPRVRELATKVIARDRAAGEAAHGRILEILGVRIEMSWDGSDKIRSFRIVGAIKAEVLGDLDGARAAIEEALSIFDAEDDVEPSLAAEAAADLAKWLNSAGQSKGAATFRDRALSLDAGNERALGLSIAAPPPSRPASAPALEPLIDGLLAKTRQDPGDGAALRELAEVAVADGHDDVAAVALTLISLFDPTAAPAEPIARPAYRAPEPSDDERTARELLRHLFTATLSRHRQSPDAHGLSPAYQIPASGERPLARAYAAALSRDNTLALPLYVHPSPARDFVIAPGQPSFVIAAARVEKREDLLPFRVGRALKLAQPEYSLLSGLEPEDAAVLLDAARAAFGPAQLMGEASAEAKSLATDLWQSIPAKFQNPLRDHVSAAPDSVAYPPMREQMERDAARAGLAVDGRLLPSLRGILADDPALRGLLIDSEGAFGEAVRASAALDELIRVALSETYLAAR